MKAGETAPARGPRGGKTTRTGGGLLRKMITFNPDEWEALRELAFREERSISSIVRDAVRLHLRLDKD